MEYTDPIIGILHDCLFETTYTDETLRLMQMHEAECEAHVENDKRDIDMAQQSADGLAMYNLHYGIGEKDYPEDYC